jgi:hypothetical protein
MSSTTALIDPDTLHTEVSAAKVLKLSVRTLQSWRSRCMGPAFIRAGRAIRYRHSDLSDWLHTNTIRPGPSSTDTAAAKAAQGLA